MVGADRGYVTNLGQMLERIDSDWVLFWIDDAFLRRRVDSHRISEILSTSLRDSLGFVLLYAAPWHILKLEDAKPGADLVEISRESKYRGSLSIGLWRKDVLKRMLHPDESAWDFERASGPRSVETRAKFFALAPRFRKAPILDVAHGLRRGTWTAEGQSFFKEEGLESYLDQRPRQGPLQGLLFSLRLLIRSHLAKALAWTVKKHP